MTNPVDEISTPDTRAFNSAASGATNIPATKQFVVNATGNLFIATTVNGDSAGNSAISAEAEEAFGQVSVFFAAITKAMAQADKSLYDFAALDNLVSGSGLFVKMTESTIAFKIENQGMTVGPQLIQALLGLSGNLASVGKSLTGLLTSVGKESLKLSRQTANKTANVGTIIFVCEYLLGAVSITPIVMCANTDEAASLYEAGPCLKTQSISKTINIQKNTFLFVPPSFIKLAGTLNDAMSDPDFDKLVDKMAQDILQSRDNEPDLTQASPAKKQPGK